jgi:hypothetical protein
MVSLFYAEQLILQNLSTLQKTDTTTLDIEFALSCPDNFRNMFVQFLIENLCKNF